MELKHCATAAHFAAEYTDVEIPNELPNQLEPWAILSVQPTYILWRTVVSTPSDEEKATDPKPAGACSEPGCMAPADSTFAPGLCRNHGFAAAGVR